MTDFIEGLRPVLLLVVLAMVLVLVAMSVDLVSGWRKATLRGDKHTSYAFSRTITKFIMYEGSLLITACGDIMAHVALPAYIDMVYNVPLLTFALAMVFCGTELWSVREKADEKTRNRVNDVAIALAKLIGKEQIVNLLNERTKNEGSEES